MQATRSRRQLPVVTVDGKGVVSHAGTALLRELADRVGLTGGFSTALARSRCRRGGHDPGQVAADLAVTIADGGEVISDLRSLADQELLHGQVASTATTWRVLNSVDENALAELRRARAAVRERAWAARGELTGAELPGSRVADRVIDHTVIDLDATLIEAHSDKNAAAPHYKGGFGFHPLLAFLDNTGEALAGMLRPGNAAAHDAADHVRVLELALAQLPDSRRRSRSWSAATPPAPPIAWSTSAPPLGWSIRSGSRSPKPCAPRSLAPRSPHGPRRSTPTAARETVPTSPRSPACSP